MTTKKARKHNLTIKNRERDRADTDGPAIVFSVFRSIIVYVPFVVDILLLLSNIHLADQPNREPVNPKNQTAVMMVNGYNGFGVNTFLSITRNFPKLYKNIIFVSVAEIDSGTFKGVEELESLEHSVRASLVKYSELARKLGFAADYRMDIGTDVVETASNLCESIAEEFPKVTFFTGKLVFRHETFFHKVLHNETALAIQRRLQWNGFMTVILPVRVDH